MAHPRLCALFLLVAALPLSGASIDAHVATLIDTDHDSSTGCAVSTPAGTFSGVERIVTTNVHIGEGGAAVTSTSIESCVDPSTSTFSAAQTIDGTGWPAGLSGNQLLVESHVPLALLGATTLPLRFAFVLTAGSRSSALDGGAAPILFPETPTNGRRRSSVPAEAARAFVMDGAGGDWNGLAPLASQRDDGTPVVLLDTFADEASGELWLRFDAKITPCAAIAVVDPDVVNGTVGVVYAAQFAATGTSGTTQFAIASGTLPEGLSLSAGGALSGVASESGVFPISVKVTDENGCTATGAAYPVVISCAMQIVNPSVATGVAGTAFNQSFSASGNDGGVSYALASGVLPQGFTLASNGHLAGTTSQHGLFPITVSGADSHGCSTVSSVYPLSIGCQSIAVTNPATTTATVGVPFTATFTQNGAIGTATFTGSVTALLSAARARAGTTASTTARLRAGGNAFDGLSLSSDGVLSGTPTTPGAITFVIQVTDANGCTGTSQPYTVTVGTAGNCGNNSPTVTIEETACAAPLDPHTLVATATSTDDDSGQCLSAFANANYTFDWGVTGGQQYVLGTPVHTAFNKSAIVFSPGENAPFSIHVEAVGNKTVPHGFAQKAITTSCANPKPTLGAIQFNDTPPSAFDGFVRGAGIAPFEGDLITLVPSASSACFTTPAFTYAWTAAAPVVLNASDIATPSYVITTPATLYFTSVVASDAFGNKSDPASLTLAASTCGVNPVSVNVNLSPGPKPFDPVSVSPLVADADADQSVCPARFHPTLSFQWSVTPSGIVDPATAQSATFLPSGNGLYTIHLVVTTSNGTIGSGSATTAIQCFPVSPTVPPPAVTFVNSAAYSNQTIVQGDVVTLGATPSTACLSNPGFTYQWTLTPADGTLLSSTSASSPSFVPQSSNTTYHVSVVVGDSLGNASASSTVAIQVQ